MIQEGNARQREDPEWDQEQVQVMCRYSREVDHSGGGAGQGSEVAVCAVTGER